VAVLRPAEETKVDGQTVVVIATTEVTTAVPSDWQLVVFVPQLVTVTNDVVRNVVVVTA
jgi:hypothetical protein